MANSRANTVRKDDNLGKDVPDIFYAAESNDVASLKLALQFYEVNARDAIGMTPLHYAASSLAVDTIEILLQQPDIDPTLADTFGRSAASLAFECCGDFADEVLEKLNPYCYPWLYKTTNDGMAP